METKKNDISMDRRWEIITNDLYNKIKPAGGDIYSRIDSTFKRSRKIENIWIEFDMNEFMYVDPFYDEQKSTSPFRMNIELWGHFGKAGLNSIHDLEHRTFRFSKVDRIGAFSNSLHFTVPKIKFGQIQNQTIEFDMEYCLTNSDSYGMMTGTINDHITKSGRIQTTLKLNDLLLHVSNNRDPLEIAGYLDKKVYALKRIRIADDLNRSFRDYKEYWVPYRREDEEDDKKWWQFWS